MSSCFILQVIGNDWTSYPEDICIFVSPDWSILKAGNKKESHKWFERQNLWTVCCLLTTLSDLSVSSNTSPFRHACGLTGLICRGFSF